MSIDAAKNNWFVCAFACGWMNMRSGSLQLIDFYQISNVQRPNQSVTIVASFKSFPSGICGWPIYSRSHSLVNATRSLFTSIFIVKVNRAADWTRQITKCVNKNDCNCVGRQLLPKCSARLLLHSICTLRMNMQMNDKEHFCSLQISLLL